MSYIPELLSELEELDEELELLEELELELLSESDSMSSAYFSVKYEVSLQNPKLYLFSI